MKKIFITLITLLVLSSCTNSKDNKAKIVCPSGAPSLAFYTEINNENFFTGDASSILPELKGEGKADVVVIDTVNGIKALNAGGNYYLAGNITFGNFYIAATGNDDNGIMEDGDYIVLFSNGATPDLIFHYIYGTSLDSNIHYVQAVNDASACLIKGINISDDERKIDEEPYVDYVMIAEPALTAALSQNENASVYANIQDLYKEKTNGLNMIQASVFVRKDYEGAKDYLDKLSNTIGELLNDPNIFANTIEDYGLSDSEVKDIFGLPNVKIATKVLTDNSIGLGYKNALENKEAIDKFINLFGIEETSEKIYFK